MPADIFLAFHPCERGYTPAFASGPFDALDASQPSRVRDAYELTLVPRPKPESPATQKLERERRIKRATRIESHPGEVSVLLRYTESV